MCICECLNICVYTTGVPCAQEGQKRTSDSLERRFQASVSCSVGSGNQTRPPAKKANIPILAIVPHSLVFVNCQLYFGIYFKIKEVQKFLSK